jgi:DNA integrity scanning protein DisA with diadenylate cyclase activity
MKIAQKIKNQVQISNEMQAVTQMRNQNFAMVLAVCTMLTYFLIDFGGTKKQVEINTTEMCKKVDKYQLDATQELILSLPTAADFNAMRRELDTLKQNNKQGHEYILKELERIKKRTGIRGTRDTVAWHYNRTDKYSPLGL